MVSESSAWFSYLAKYTKKCRASLICIGVLVILSSILALSVPFAIKVIFDNWGTQNLRTNAFISAVVCLCLMFIKYFLDYFYKTLAAKKTSSMFAEMVKDFYEHMLSLGMDFYIGTKSGEFMQSFDQDMYVIVRMVMNDFLSLFSSIIQVLLMICFLAFINPVLMLISIAFAPAYYLLKKSTDKKTKRANDNMLKRWGEASSNIHENLTGIRAIKETNAETFFVEKNSQYLNEVAKAFYDLEKQTAKTNVVTSLFNQVVPFIVMIIGLLIYKANGMSAGGVFAFFYVIIGFFSPLGAIVIQSNSIQKGKVSVERVRKYFQEESNVREKESARSIEKLIGNISFENATFGYNEKDVLRNIDLRIKNGESVAIVGSSGAGKSTLLNLLYRLYDAKDGLVKIDDIDVKDYKLSDLRKQIGYVGQETVLFHTTIKENLQIANSNASMEDIYRACKIAGIHDAIMQKENKYETVIGEKGMKLSGGQRQRIALARMILKKPSIAIFDESFSNIDSETEYAFFESIKNELRGKTILIISHRLSSIINTDKIVYMENGSIVEIDTHEKIFQRNPKYRELWKEQAAIN